MRKPGYYWVQFKGIEECELVWFTGNVFLVPGVSKEYNINSFDHIDETPITHTRVYAEKNDNLIDEVNNEITNVHEHMEGRYQLDGSDLFNIHHLLCRFQNMLMK